MENLKSIFAESRKFPIAGQEIEIKSLALGDIPVALDLVMKFFDLQKSSKNEKNKNEAMLAAVQKDMPSVLKVLEVTTNLKPEDIKRLNLAAATIIIMEVVKENADFLQQNVVPAVQKAMEQVNGLNKSKNL